MEDASHILVHRNHRDWRSEDATLLNEVAAWQQELAAARSEVSKIEVALREHENALETHAAALRGCQQNILAHEHALAEFERGKTGKEILELPETHHGEHQERIQQLAVHERLKKHHYTIISLLELVTRAITNSE
jgi:hypothetical protein